MLIKNNASRIHQIGGKKMIQLMPGVNVVDPELWAEAEKVKVVQHYLDTEEFQVIDEKATGPKDKNAKEAAKLASETFDLALLKSWLDDEPRAGVTKAIQAQIDLINAAGDVPPPAEG